MAENCPSHQLFYVCNLNGFRGCCPFDPCSQHDACHSLADGTTSMPPTSVTHGSSATSSTVRTVSPMQSADINQPSSTGDPQNNRPTGDPRPLDSDSSGGELPRFVIPLTAGLGAIVVLLLIALGLFVRWGLRRSRKDHRDRLRLATTETDNLGAHGVQGAALQELESPAVRQMPPVELPVATPLATGSGYHVATSSPLDGSGHQPPHVKGWAEL